MDWVLEALRQKDVLHSPGTPPAWMHCLENSEAVLQMQDSSLPHWHMSVRHTLVKAAVSRRFVQSLNAERLKSPWQKSWESNITTNNKYILLNKINDSKSFLRCIILCHVQTGYLVSTVADFFWRGFLFTVLSGLVHFVLVCVVCHTQFDICNRTWHAWMLGTRCLDLSPMFRSKGFPIVDSVLCMSI